MVIQMNDDARVVMIDGSIVAPEHAVVSVYDRGFLYGDSVFETLRSYQGRPFASRSHIDRLFLSARKVRIQMPVSEVELEREVETVVETFGTTDAAVRIQVTRGLGPLGLSTAEAKKPLLVILASPVHPPSLADYQNGIGVVIVRTERTADNTPAAGAKVGNYLVSVMAMEQAQAAGAKEAIIVDGRGRVLEGTTSNVFVVHGGTVLTPPESVGILPGITRKLLIDVACELEMPVKITTLTTGDLLSADEVFISSTVREVLPVVAVDGQSVGNGMVGSQTRAIHRRFRQKFGIVGPMPWEASDRNDNGVSCED